MRTQLRLRLAPNFADHVARTGTSLRAFAAAASVAEATIHALINPAQHPERRGGMQRATAWKLANSYAQIAKITPEEAFSLLIIEEARPKTNAPKGALAA